MHVYFGDRLGPSGRLSSFPLMRSLTLSLLDYLLQLPLALLLDLLPVRLTELPHVVRVQGTVVISSHPLNAFAGLSAKGPDVPQSLH